MVVSVAKCPQATQGVKYSDQVKRGTLHISLSQSNFVTVTLDFRAASLKCKTISRCLEELSALNCQSGIEQYQYII